MRFKELAGYWQKIASTPSRLEMTKILADLFTLASKDEIEEIVYLSLGSLRPKFEGIEFQLAEKMMLRVIAGAYNQPLLSVTNQFKKLGDLGELVDQGQDKNLSVAEVYKRLFDIAVDEGSGSQERKVNSMARLLNDLDKLSSKFVVRIPVNKLRLGFSDMTVLDALSWMIQGDKSLRIDLERAFNVSADIGRIAKAFKAGGMRAVSTIKVKVGVPIRVARAERLPSAEAMVEKLQVFAVEGKWDGLRMEIHFDKGQYVSKATQENLFKDQSAFVRIFSRSLDNQTAMFPDVVAAVQKLPVRSIILDGEAVAYDPKTGKLLPFQETVTRKRKHGVGQKMREVPIKVFIYDLLYLDGTTLIHKPFRDRRKTLEKIFAKVDSPTLALADQEIVSDTKHLKKLLKKYLDMGLEGVMCKKLSTPYQAGSRNFNWVKFKKTTQGELVDTIDAVVMGYYAGKGKRSGFGIGAFLVGLPDDTGKIGSIAKIGTGLSDEQWKEMYKRAQKLKVNGKPSQYLVDKNLNCDVWVRPELVVEILADEITKSPIHAHGLALRFPRLVRFRDDKAASEATSKVELERLFKLQNH